MKEPVVELIRRFAPLPRLPGGWRLAFSASGPLKGTASEFTVWLGSDEEAWFFLDSVDEAQRETPRAFDARAERRMNDELHAAGFVEKPFCDHHVLGRHRP